MARSSASAVLSRGWIDCASRNIWMMPGTMTDQSTLKDRLRALEQEHRDLDDVIERLGEAVPFGRMGVAEDLTGMAVFLASEDARYIVGQTYNVDGGNWMS